MDGMLFGSDTESDVMMGHILVTLNFHIWHEGHAPSVRQIVKFIWYV